ncbi:antA/AntB antirepressor family protein [uncultured Clostridium sp.]|uniref:antA/AntB antirepressor family protein n=1 Tax=uncultured Clostridium sp. TaxID=59620 RepID=UPI00261EDAA2|nr:antA/AntB antirepressor family protein [uncultured Clostridium sp.]
MELIKIKNEKGVNLVSARELHKILESKQDFTTWIKSRIEKYGFVEDEDFTLHKFMEGKNWKHDYILKLDMAKELSMVENNDKGRKVRRYFIECEKKLVQVLSNKDSLLLNIIKSNSETDRALALNQYQVEYVKPLEDKIEVLTHVNKLYTSTEIAKELGLKSATELNKLLSDKKIQYKVNNTWVLTAKYSNAGYESIKQTVLDNGKVIYDRKFTQIGRDFILNLFKGVGRDGI